MISKMLIAKYFPALYYLRQEDSLEEERYEEYQ